MAKTTGNKELEAIVKAAVEKHGKRAEAFVPILLEINHENGYIPREAIRLTRQFLHEPEEPMLVSEGQLYGLASFYQMLNTEKTGRHLVRFCESAPCHVEGGRELWKAIQKTLGISDGETDRAGRFTLQRVSCLGLCAIGPVLVIDEDVHGQVCAEKLKRIFARYE